MRIEKDSLGELSIPDDVFYGIQSFRASKNFPISGTQVHPQLIRSFLLLKKAAAKANQASGVLDEQKAAAIATAVDELLKGNYLKHFIVDAYQAGAGTSQNMNANEVIANKANVLLGGKLGTYDHVHPNDHVNMSQSTNDTYPTAMRLATLILSKELVSELQRFSNAFKQKALEFDLVIKSGRTHLQDAVPIRLGQEFSAYQKTIEHLIGLVIHSQDYLRELGIGGSAAGTGINVPKGFREAIIIELKHDFEDSDLTLSDNMCAAMQSQLPMMVYSNALRTCALELTRITNDLRLLSSGPANGLGEINLPSTQPGSSIMPGKVNPSILEMANQVFFKVLGNDQAMAFANQAGQLELNVMMPVMAQLALESSMILTSALKTMRELCISGITANKETCEKYASQTSQIVTALNPVIGYAKAGELAKESIKSKKTVIELVREQKLLTDKQIKDLLDPKKLTVPH
ncbi:aspartate ammonia-lyase [Bacteriovorax stolpii]|uniref:Aspartate ammonia-lyase n=1 Tax=Bacteriovorax stolpii TaxID=960 RepID=A0A2K9NPQ6_BACTC|nr:aspartate ammonia-lyase [Bacteriovorax stolpii]AUN97487.1 aspartate ammonia-lyase [Bacteriovorax stolpii]TDP52665.1 aspartate ammonia-lyase [Bacteriovorax stolpii]